MTKTGTLMWVGNRSSPEFADAYSFCESHTAQLAVRCDLADAAMRPAAAVNRILVTQSTRRPLDAFALQAVANEYPQASLLKLQATLCEGMRSPVEPAFDHAHYWHQWNQVLPAWITPCGDAPRALRSTCRSVAIVAQHYQSAEPLMELAAAADVTVVACLNGHAHQVRNVDAVWWDDSAACPVSSDAWKQRISAFDADNGNAQHVWIANSPRHHQLQQASLGGISLVVSKPHRIECLLDSIVAPANLASDRARAA